ncbi:MAG: sigma-70 family RNA polymerase sigma factor [Candidatus Symbiothrix sp.]|jgi:RNA polymerase sigma-70 factor (ECF subfamily)|nr:sigma-70 family RNA polymerase sigma factor [Candidatus Symbiothrix sp.]
MYLEQFKKEIIPLRQKLLAFSLKMLENKDDAEDAVQEAFLKLWNIRGQLQTIEEPDAFAMQTAKNICIDKLRSRKDTVDVSDIYMEVAGNNPHKEVENADAVAIIRRIIENLPELQRLIIRMRDIEDYELSEIAEIMGTQIAAVTMNLSRARKKVRERFLKAMNYKM